MRARAGNVERAALRRSFAGRAGAAGIVMTLALAGGASASSLRAVRAGADPCTEESPVASAIGDPFGYFDGVGDNLSQNVLSDTVTLIGWALDPTIEAACAAGIVVVSFSQVVTAPCPYKVNTNWASVNHDIPTWMANVLGGEGKILLDEGLPGSPISEASNIEIANVLSIKTSSASVLVDRLIRQRMLKRRHDDKDRRVVWVTATPQGRKVVAQILRQKRRSIQEIFAPLSDRERQDYLSALLKVKSHFEKDI